MGKAERKRRRFMIRPYLQQETKYVILVCVRIDGPDKSANKPASIFITPPFLVT